ncbi:acyl-CoA dehydrogenase family protein [Variovorax saccharolyticus]|uniref:acyl-CoA dehydrogenase family protein n=1 Tax=Variovorax saccharolyticus TaxID=3053516 RepID=UPI0025789243|nr:acyl-CoA dehydrogenase family protein [Variovorax sp. J22R187]MDM0020963.1 acyl-CoA dehydrogenase family protein [Variovorax sp. J22R187]
MSTSDNDLKPEEFAQAAAEAIKDAQTRDFRGAAQVLASAGLCGVCAREDAGGLALGIEFALPIVAEAGKLRLHWPLLETLLIAKALGDSPLAAELASGERVATWALQGSLQDAFAGHARHARDCDWVLVADGRGGGALLALSSVEIQDDEALDPEHPQSWLTLDGATVLAELDAATFSALQCDSHILIAGLVNGAAEAALATTADYMSTRVQFGRPLSAKQAVRHLLARMRLLQEASNAGIRRVLHTDEYGQLRSARPVLANALANACFVLEKSIHLHGGMGFTWEVPLHYALREVRKFDAAFGSGALASQVGRDFIQSQ